ncbi:MULTISPECIES: phosphoethanolamine transferase [Ramlibacter]|uniref:Phosphoethanolamine--lipid A transferase n=1 Tax=Ramlibacter pinisoli TaxID=2682844 RepID=A0A6N8ING2_9BURK|nr:MULTISPECIES: phosphoethanolamine--lipid A transferase [Ramlibacter]MBA2963391.1 phosphoethanolamine--lipid A transferase [Ramlibacter sp. CGMCC 1.13660]MVQ28358.1 phosphoethanolamine--lipid A transferase [Ramlibacter pinisoli]
MPIRRPSLHVETLLLACALYLLLACNLPFWRAALAGRDWALAGTWALAAAMFASFTGAYVAFTGLLATRWTVRLLLVALVLVAAALSFYMDRYAIFFDRTMLRNVLATNPGEARELLGLDFLVHMVLFGVVPAALLCWPRLLRRSRGRAVLVRAAWVLGGFVVMVVALLPVFADFASLMRNQREVRFLLNPGNAVAAVIAEAWGGRGRPAQLLAVGPDAHLAAGWQQRRKTLFVLVVGETARAQNFGLGGYSRQTTPELARRDVVNFTQATACGTSTEVSLPCMFSSIGRRNYDEDRILSHESLLHVLQRAGIEVLWRDNQSGCKGVCAGLKVQEMARTLAPELCPGGTCFDEALLDGLGQVAMDAKGNLFVVLHQLGSHGPAYFRRYPPAFRRFVPACEQEELRRCTQAEIVNAYDNTLLYTDHVLGRLVDLLQAQDASLDTAMLYVSDHGESLGESGLYLHGVPFPIAPDVQKHVPMVAWVSPGFVRSTGLDLACLRGRAGRPVSHDNLFHSVLGALDVQTQAYERDLDVFAPCRSR